MYTQTEVALVKYISEISNISMFCNISICILKIKVLISCEYLANPFQIAILNILFNMSF